MPAYHSEFNDAAIMNRLPLVSGIYLVPFKTSKARSGTLGVASGSAAPYLREGADVIDEAIQYFRANVLFRHFDIQRLNDRLLIYITLLISEALGRIKLDTKAEEATKAWSQSASARIPLPGDADIPLSSLYPAPESRTEADQLRAYLVQLRQETHQRLHSVLYPPGSTGPNKWWMAFQKRKFMNKSF